MNKIEVPFSLLTLLRTRRPHNTKEESDTITFIDNWVSNLMRRKPKNNIRCYRDNHNNLHVKVKKCESIHFTAHVDTVHYFGGTQEVLGLHTPIGLMITAEDTTTKKPCVLGADDACGVYLMLEMIEAGVPGIYHFFRGEERGCVGSRAYRKSVKRDRYDIMIAFDRRGTQDVIAKMGGEVCCSPRFAEALSEAINKASGGELNYKPCLTGGVTDAKQYIGIAREVTNISVGYFNEHTVDEHLNLTHLLKLRDALLKIDFNALPRVKQGLALHSLDKDTLYNRILTYMSKSSYINIEVEDIMEDLLEFFQKE